MEPNADELAVPDLVSHYVIKERLACGAFGVVHLALDQRDGSSVAVKFALLDLDIVDNLRFEDEAKLLSQLNHPGIVRFIDAGTSGRFHYLVSAFVPGETLESWLQVNQPTPAQSVDIAIELASALAHTHAHRVVHRDLKPQNIIMRDNCHPVIVDFDLAIHDLIGSTAKRRRGVVAGTLSYMSPEQVMGQGHRIDGRTDIYSLGVILYQMLTGHLPFRSRDAEELRQQIRQDDPQPPRQLVGGVPPILERVCLKAMAKDFADRYATADDLASDLGYASRQLSAGGTLANESMLSPLEVPAATTTDQIANRRKPTNRSSMQWQITLVNLECDLFVSPSAQTYLNLDQQSEMHEQFMQFCEEIVTAQHGRLVGRTHLGGLFSFGFPIAGDICLRRGVRTAIEFQEKFAPFAARWQRTTGVSVSATAVVHRDRAVVVNSADHANSDQFEVNGRLRYLVSEMARVAPPGQVVLSDAGRHGIESVFQTKPIRSISLSESEKLTLHRVCSHSDVGPMDWAMLRGQITPLVGRNDEMDGLSRRWHQTIRGKQNAVMISGEPGIGKSRLVQWLCQSVCDQGNYLDQKVREQRESPVMFIRSDAYYQQSSLHGVIECLRRRIGINDGIPGIKQLSRLVRYLDDLGIEGDQEVALMASLLSISLAGCYPALNLSPSAKKEATFQLLIHWLQATAEQHPVLMVVEDLHWCDPSTLELLGRIISAESLDSVLLVMTHRPEFADDWNHRPGLDRTTLKRLSDAEAEEMFAACMGENRFDRSEAAMWLERTDGIPLFVEQIATMLESGPVPLDDAIPHRLQDLLLSRMQLGGGIPEAIQRAAAVGRDFGWDIVKAICDSSDDELLGELNTLVDSSLLFRRSVPDGWHFTFKHALIQDAAYETMIASQRKLTHGRIAKYFLSRKSVCPAEVVAHHLHRAEEWDQAVESWYDAAQTATQAAAHQEAESHLGFALEALGQTCESSDRDRKEVELRCLLGVHLQAIHGYAAAEVFENYARALQVCERINDPLVTFPIAYGLFRYHVLQSQLRQASELAELLLETADGTLNTSMKLMAHRAAGTTATYRGQLSSARIHLEAILAVAPSDELRQEISKTDVVDVWVTARSYLALTLWLQGETEQAFYQSEQAISEGEQLPHPISLILPVGFSQWLHQMRADVDRTEATCDRSDQLGKDFGFPFWNAWTLTLRGWIQSARGDHAGARQTIQDGVTQWRASGTTAGCHYFYALLAESCLKDGDFEAATLALDQAQSFADETGERFYEAEILRLRGEIVLAIDPKQSQVAADWFRRAIAFAEKQGTVALKQRAVDSMSSLPHVASPPSEPPRGLTSEDAFG
ncbi:protein kinase domain-containing protein [Rhodopirellula europaea]|uniref:Adenylate/guanylate cyclase n=1 Tax=Rhodopirellula europaea 6C TaxID=1263867 RepID=M2A436_9BACT|nr:protein kinase [Rhodopirellula europaea]EMB14211.1 adenylate/guanylate cyclase [Rhodopirellula europaea 6C]